MRKCMPARNQASLPTYTERVPFFSLCVQRHYWPTLSRLILYTRTGIFAANLAALSAVVVNGIRFLMPIRHTRDAPLNGFGITSCQL